MRSETLLTFLRRHLEPKSGCYDQSILPCAQEDIDLLTFNNGSIIDFTKRISF